MDKPSDWTAATRAPFGMLNDAWARASRHHRAPPALESAVAPAARPARRGWGALVALVQVWFMPRH